MLITPSVGDDDDDDDDHETDSDTDTDTDDDEPPEVATRVDSMAPGRVRA